MIQLSPPWVTFANEMKAMFKDDDSVRVVFDQVNMKLKLYVQSAVKAEALGQLLVKQAEFGGVTVDVEIIPGNATSDRYVNTYATAFESNPALFDTRYADGPLGSFTYIIWTGEVAQFFDDNLSDYQGKKTMLMEDIARDVLAEQPHTFHCTVDMSDSVQKVWP